MKDGGPAFPKTATGSGSYSEDQPGMTLRDYFAAAALTGHLSNPDTTNHPAFDRDGLASECFQIADAMLAEREKREATKSGRYDV